MVEKNLSTYQRTRRIDDLVKLYQPYRQKVFRMCMHYLKNPHDSEDAVVDIFLELKEKLLKYDIENFPAWLHTLTRNHCLKKLRGKGRIILTDEIFSGERVESEYLPDQIDEWLGKLPDAIDALDERQRWCIVLFYLRGMSYKDIEKHKGYTAMEVKSAIQNGKKKLKKILEDS